MALLEAIGGRLHRGQHRPAMGHRVGPPGQHEQRRAVQPLIRLVQAVFSPGGFVPLTDRLANFTSTVRTNQFKRCPGASEAPASDGSNVWSAEEQKELDCVEEDRATEPNE